MVPWRTKLNSVMSPNCDGPAVLLPQQSAADRRIRRNWMQAVLAMQVMCNGYGRDTGNFACGERKQNPFDRRLLLSFYREFYLVTRESLRRRNLLKRAGFESFCREESSRYPLYRILNSERARSDVTWRRYKFNIHRFPIVLRVFCAVSQRRRFCSRGGQ